MITKLSFALVAGFVVFGQALGQAKVTPANDPRATVSARPHAKGNTDDRRSAWPDSICLHTENLRAHGLALAN